MRYRSSDDYGRRSRSSTGRYSEGDDYMNDIRRNYGNYSRGYRHGSKEETIKALECLLQNLVDFIEILQEEADTQEEVDLIKRYSRQLSEI